MKKKSSSIALPVIFLSVFKLIRFSQIIQVMQKEMHQPLHFHDRCERKK